MENDVRARTTRRDRVAVVVQVLVVVLAVGVVSKLALYRLRGYPYPLDPTRALEGASTTWAVTAPTAAGTWAVLGLALLALASWLKRRTPDLTPGEATAGAVVVFWSGAYVALLALGPLGLYRPWILRALLVAVFAATFRPTRWRTGAEPSWGPWIATGAVLLAAGPLFIMQLGSPVSPFMDVLPYVAATEKIVTFHFYDAFANDAAGIWPPSRQVPGVDGVFSVLALAAGRSARLTVTSLIVPVAALQVLAIYLLGRHVHGRMSGAMAALFLLQTFLWRRSADVRSTALAFPLVAIGLAFLLGARQSRARFALGGLSLGLSVAVNPLIGAFGMLVASLGAIVDGLDLRRFFVARIVALAGGSVFALPVVFLGIGWPVPSWVLAACAMAGCATLAVLARPGSHAELAGSARRALPLVRLITIVAVPLLVLYHHARGSEYFTNDWFGYPVLALLALCGIVVTAEAVWRRPAGSAVAVPALALLVGIGVFEVVGPWRFQGGVEIRANASEVIPKIILYWSPYWMALLGGVWFGMLARQWSRVASLLLALLLVIYPVRYVAQPVDYDGAELSLAGTWGFHLGHATNGYWAGRGDRRWVLDDNWRAVADALKSEVAAGRIGYYTHVMVISPSTESVELPLETGISADLITPRYDPNGYWNLGSRMRGFDSLPAAFAKRPSFVVVEHFPPQRFPELEEYDEVVSRDYVRLYRRRTAGG